MLSLLCPHWVFDDYTAVTPEFLRERGVRLLLCDLDYTLAPKRQKEPDEPLKAWIGALRASGVTVVILSNNRSSARVKRFCAPLGIGYVGHAGKPSARGFDEAMARYGVRAEETAMLGDKLLTDTLGARRMEPCAARTPAAIQAGERARCADGTGKFAKISAICGKMLALRRNML